MSLDDTINDDWLCGTSEHLTDEERAELKRFFDSFMDPPTRTDRWIGPQDGDALAVRVELEMPLGYIYSPGDPDE